MKFIEAHVGSNYSGTNRVHAADPTTEYRDMARQRCCITLCGRRAFVGTGEFRVGWFDQCERCTHKAKEAQ